MMEEEKKSKNSLGVQDTLSLGYIYLLILGIIHNAIYYNSVDVNYLEHSSVLDVLISPISIITSSFAAIIAFVVIIVISILYIKLLIPLLVKNQRKKEKYQSGKHLKKLNGLESLSKSKYSLLFIIGLFIFGYFVGFGQGRGAKNKKRITEDNIEHNIKIDFINGKSIEARLIGKNSLNIFYIQKGDKSVSISPVEGNVMKMQELKD